jgi:hypothetical protein
MDQAVTQRNYDQFEGNAQELNQLFADALPFFHYRGYEDYGLTRHRWHLTNTGWVFEHFGTLQKFLYEEMNRSCAYPRTFLSVVESLEGFAAEIGMPLWRPAQEMAEFRAQLEACNDDFWAGQQSVNISTAGDFTINDIDMPDCGETDPSASQGSNDSSSQLGSYWVDLISSSSSSCNSSPPPVSQAVSDTDMMDVDMITFTDTEPAPATLALPGSELAPVTSAPTSTPTSTPFILPCPRSVSPLSSPACPSPRLHLRLPLAPLPPRLPRAPATDWPSKVQPRSSLLPSSLRVLQASARYQA